MRCPASARPISTVRVLDRTEQDFCPWSATAPSSTPSSTTWLEERCSSSLPDSGASRMKKRKLTNGWRQLVSWPHQLCFRCNSSFTIWFAMTSQQMSIWLLNLKFQFNFFQRFWSTPTASAAPTLAATSGSSMWPCPWLATRPSSSWMNQPQVTKRTLWVWVIRLHQV